MPRHPENDQMAIDKENAPMNPRLAAGLIAAAVLLAASPGAHAQVGLGVAAGPVFPTGSLGDAVESGFHAGVVADVGIPFVPFGVRGDLTYQRLPGAGDLPSYSHFAVTVNGRLSVVPLPLVAPYVTAGLGLYSSAYHADVAEPAPGRDTEMGLNGGVGARLNLLVVRPFVEARYHRVMADPARAFVPITVGVFF